MIYAPLADGGMHDGCQGSDGCTNQVLVARRRHDAGNTKGRV